MTNETHSGRERGFLHHRFRMSTLNHLQTELGPAPSPKQSVSLSVNYEAIRTPGVIVAKVMDIDNN